MNPNAKKSILISIFCSFLSLSIASVINDSTALREEQVLDSLAVSFLNGQEIKLAPDTFQKKKSEVRKLQKIVSEEFSYRDFKSFFFLVQPTVEQSPSLLEGMLKLERRALLKSEETDTFYIESLIKLVHLSRNLNRLGIADSLNQVLEEYSSGVNDLSIRNKGLAFVQFHKCVVAMLQHNLMASQNAIESGIQLANESEDTSLQVASLYYQSELYRVSGKLQAFLEVCQRAYSLDSAQSRKSDYYMLNLQNWLDGLIHANTNHKRIVSIIEELEDFGVKELILDWKLKYLAGLSESHWFVQEEFEKFKVTSLVDLIEKYRLIAVKFEGQRFYTAFLRQAARVLGKLGHQKESFHYVDEALANQKMIYSVKLSEDLAKIEASKVAAAKDAEIALEKERRSWLLRLVSLVVGILVVISILFINKSRFAKKLSVRNSEIKQQQELLEKADAQKAMMLKEIHHRVKNNFEVVKSLLDLQVRRVEEPNAKAMAIDGKNRIAAMALVHQKLYRKDSFRVPFYEYVCDLLQNTKAIFGVEAKLDIEKNDYDFDVDTAIPLGLVLNELTTNAFKYATTGQPLELSIKLTETKSGFLLEVRDSGPGLKDPSGIENSKTLGLRLIHRLTEQLNGKVEYEYRGGAWFKIFFEEQDTIS